MFRVGCCANFELSKAPAIEGQRPASAGGNLVELLEAGT